MNKFIVPFCLALVYASAAHSDWLTSSRECGNRLSSQTGCASCSALWPEISRCAGEAEGVDMSRVDTCIKRVNAQDWNKPMYVDRVGAVGDCLGR
jgi:hypothetical protein